MPQPETHLLGVDVRGVGDTFVIDDVEWTVTALVSPRRVRLRSVDGDELVAVLSEAAR